MHYLTANLGPLCALDERILPCFLSLSTECERIDPPLPCASCITCINLFSPRFLASYFARRGDGRPTQPGSSDPRGCCITNITSPLFVYFLPTTTQRTTGLGKAKLKKTVFPTTGANSLSFSSSQGHLIWYVLHQGGKSLLPPDPG